MTDPSGDPERLITVEVVFALPGRQRVVRLVLASGTTAREAVQRSGLAAQFPDQTLAGAPLGVFGHRVDADFVLADGDRLEIYRPLCADPKEVRRALAAEGRTMGRDR